MLRSASARRLLLGLSLAGAVGVAGCNSDNTLTGLNTVTSPATLTDTFSDTLTTHGAKTFPFVVQNPGDITATLSNVAPDNTQILGLALGIWNGAACSIVLTNDAAVSGTSLDGSANAAGNFCVRVFDATGTLPQPESYTVSVLHP